MAAKLKVLIPVDFSETSRRALAWAFDYATRAPCELHLLHVLETHLAHPDLSRNNAELAADLAGIAAEATAELERMVPDLDERRDVGAIHRHVTHGRPAHEILRIADQIGAETIVMGSHGRTGVAGLLIGSVAEKVVRHAHCPVVCVKPGTAATVPTHPAHN